MGLPLLSAMDDLIVPVIGDPCGHREVGFTADPYGLVAFIGRERPTLDCDITAAGGEKGKGVEE